MRETPEFLFGHLDFIMGVITALFTAVLTYFVVYVKRRMRYQLLSDSEVEVLYQHVRKILGVTKDGYTINAQVLADGSAKTMVEMVVRNYGIRDLTGIDYTFASDSLTPIDITNLIIKKVASGRDNIDVKINMAVLSVHGNRVNSHFRFLPPLSVGQEVRFAIERTSPVGTFRMNIQSSEVGRFREYMSVNIAHPMNLMSLNVEFPQNYYPKAFSFEVTFGSSQVVHEPEMSRIRRSNGFITFEKDKCIHCMLKVRYPILGLRYVVNWIPPTKENDVLQQTSAVAASNLQ